MEQMIVHVGVVSLNTFNCLKKTQKLDEIVIYMWLHRKGLDLNYFYFLLIVPREARKLVLVC